MVIGSTQAGFFALEQDEGGAVGEATPCVGGRSRRGAALGQQIPASIARRGDQDGLAAPQPAQTPRGEGKIVDGVAFDLIRGPEALMVGGEVRVEIGPGLAGNDQGLRGDVVLRGVFRGLLFPGVRDRTVGFSAVAARGFLLFIGTHVGSSQPRE